MIIVIADDLTGAAEISGVCLRYDVNVAFGIDRIPEQSETVVVIATDSRSQTESEAYKTHQKIAKQVFEKTKNAIVFKKCDSVIRGYVLTELKALMEASVKPQVLLQPSNPEGNRIIKNGVYYVDNVKIENTGFSTDPDFPAKTSSLAEILSERTSRAQGISVKTGPIESMDSEGVYVPDCQNEADLAKNLNLYKEDILIGGSAAFFGQFLNKLGIASAKKEFETLNFTDGYVLVSGSTHPESVAFAKTLDKNGCSLLTFPNHLLAENCNDNGIREFADQAIETYVEHQKLVLRISDENIQFKNSSNVLKQRLSRVVAQLVSRVEIKELFIEGGASAYDILKKLNWETFTPKAAFLQGVVRMQHKQNQYITIKPGSYKWPNGFFN